VALAPGLQLARQAGMLEALRGQQHAGAAPARPLQRGGQFRVHLRVHLRGLLALRHEQVIRGAGEFGEDRIHLVAEAEAHLRAQGSKPGADGIHRGQLPGRD
jgi:hypothetical protein